MKAAPETVFENTYSSGNLRKYRSANPLRRILVGRMQSTIVSLCEKCVGDAVAPRILDAGCGEGINAALLEKRLPRAKLTLLDVSEGALAYAASLCSGDCEFRCGSVMELPFPDGTFDLVLCSEVLEHLERPEGALAELQRVSSGSVLISVPHEPWFRAGNLLTLRNVKRFGDPPDHLNHWTFSGFRRWVLIRSDGWKNAFYRSFPWSIALLRREGIEPAGGRKG